MDACDAHREDGETAPLAREPDGTSLARWGADTAAAANVALTAFIVGDAAPVRVEHLRAGPARREAARRTAQREAAAQRLLAGGTFEGDLHGVRIALHLQEGTVLRHLLLILG